MHIAKIAVANGNQNRISSNIGAEGNEHLAKVPSSETNPNAGTDTVYISAEAKNLLGEIYKDRQTAFLEMKEQLSNIREQDGSPYDIELKCIKIAMRILNGDYVPKQDEKFLAENNPEMYLRAIMLRKQNEDPEEYDSLLEEEESSTDESSTASEAVTSVASASSPDITADTTAASNDSTNI